MGRLYVLNFMGRIVFQSSFYWDSDRLERQITGHPAGIRINRSDQCKICSFLMFPLMSARMRCTDCQFTVSGAGFLQRVILRRRTVRGLNSSSNSLVAALSASLYCPVPAAVFAVAAAVLIFQIRLLAVDRFHYLR